MGMSSETSPIRIDKIQANSQTGMNEQKRFND